MWTATSGFSGFYGLLRPLDGIHPHRLEMDSPIKNTRVSQVFMNRGAIVYISTWPSQILF